MLRSLQLLALFFGAVILLSACWTSSSDLIPADQQLMPLSSPTGSLSMVCEDETPPTPITIGDKAAAYGFTSKITFASLNMQVEGRNGYLLSIVDFGRDKTHNYAAATVDLPAAEFSLYLPIGDHVVFTNLNDLKAQTLLMLTTNEYEKFVCDLSVITDAESMLFLREEGLSE